MYLLCVMSLRKEEKGRVCASVCESCIREIKSTSHD